MPRPSTERRNRCTPNVVWIDLDDLNLKKGAPVQAFDLAADLEASGEVSDKFRPAKPFEFIKAGASVQ